MSAQRQVVVNGPGIYSFVSTVGVIFIVLKLVGVIAWSWWWVLAPFWIPTAVVLVLFGITFGCFAIANVEMKRRREKRLADFNTKRAGR